MQHPIFSAPLSALFAGVVLSVAATGAMAQTTTPTTNPTTVGVTPQDAAEATRKAVPRADTGTVVRTDESAADKARNAADAAADKTRNAADSARTGTTETRTTPSTSSTAPMNSTATGTMPAASTGNDASVNRNTSNTQRRARADRN